MSRAEASIVGAATILERFTSDNPTHERNAAKRILAQVIRAWPGDPERLWWKWLVEASISIGLRPKVVDCSTQEAYALAADRAQFVCFRSDGFEFEWLSILASSRKRYEVLLADQDERDKKLTGRALRKQLERFSENDRIRCVVMQPCEGMTSSEYSNEQKMEPFNRLLALFKPESSDIWLVLVFAFTVSLLMLATPMAVEALVNTVAFGRFLQPILVLAVILLTFLAFQGAISALQTFVVEIVQRRLFARISADLAFRLPRTEAEATDGTYVPETVNRFFDVVTVQKVAAQLLLDGLGLVLSTMIGMAVLGFYHPWLLGFDVFLLVAILVTIFVLGRGAITSAIKESKHKYYMASWLQDVSRCSSAFHGDGGPEFALERTDRLVHDYLVARKKHFRILMRQILFALGLQAVASTVLLGIGGWLVVSGELTLGQLVAAELIVTVIVGSFAKFGKHMEGIYDLTASIDKLGVIFDISLERQDGMLLTGSSSPLDIHLNAVTYNWPGEPAVLNQVSAHFHRGERIAVVGQSGSGKSTLMDLLYGVRSPTAGHLTIDDFDPRDIRPDILRTRVALAREGEVFHATIEENVHLHRENVIASDVRQVLRRLGLLGACLALPDGCLTVLSNDGQPLSSNQRRLLSLARAAAGRPGLLLVDGLLDPLAEDELAQVLDFLCDREQPWTLVVATARQDIADRLDESIRLDDPGFLRLGKSSDSQENARE